MSGLKSLGRKLADHSLEEILREGPGYVTWRAKRRAIAACYRSYLTVQPNQPSLDTTRAKRAVAEADELLFLCLGNICRSPFAERYARRRLEAHGIDDLAVDSAGLGEASGRASPPLAVEAAHSHDVDLSSHTSVTDHQSISDDTVVFVMDYNNYHNARRTYLGTAERTFFLNVFSPGEEVAIRDPNGTNLQTFNRVYGGIAECIEVLIDAYLYLNGEDGDSTQLNYTNPTPSNESSIGSIDHRGHH